MKREFPVLWAKASMWVASPLILLVTVLFVSQVITRTAADVYAVGMTAFGVTAALAGICFTVPKEAAGSSDTHYAGEKFLHSAVLLIQSYAHLHEGGRYRICLGPCAHLDKHGLQGGA